MDTNIAIIGAGVVGLAIAVELSQHFNNIVVLERHPSFGYDQSSRNSEVIHAGMYYPTNSLKAKLCVEGNRLLYEWAIKYKVSFDNCEKLIIATSHNELDTLHSIFNQGIENGLTTIELISQEKIHSLEPNIFAIEAIRSKSTGIIDSHQFMQSLENYAYNNGVLFSYNSKVTQIHKIQNGYELQILSADESYSLGCDMVINSAGLYSDRIAQLVGIDITANNYEINFVRGHYYNLSGKYHNHTSRLIYPVPPADWTSIGIHITRDLQGYLRLGPDVQYLEEKIEDYQIPSSRIDLFYESARRYLPNLEKNDLSPAYSGIRAKLQKKGEKFRDFVIKNEKDLGYDGFINLIGIESPGLTSSLAIAKYVKKIIDSL